MQISQSLRIQKLFKWIIDIHSIQFFIVLQRVWICNYFFIINKLCMRPARNFYLLFAMSQNRKEGTLVRSESYLFTAILLEWDVIIPLHFIFLYIFLFLPVCRGTIHFILYVYLYFLKLQVCFSFPCMFIIQHMPPGCCWLSFDYMHMHITMTG